MRRVRTVETRWIRTSEDWQVLSEIRHKTDRNNATDSRKMERRRKSDESASCPEAKGQRLILFVFSSFSADGVKPYTHKHIYIFIFIGEMLD